MRLRVYQRFPVSVRISLVAAVIRNTCLSFADVHYQCLEYLSWRMRGTAKVNEGVVNVRMDPLLRSAFRLHWCSVDAAVLALFRACLALIDMIHVWVVDSVICDTMRRYVVRTICATTF